MIPKYAREEMKDALPRIAAIAEKAIDSLRGYSPVPSWSKAIDAVLAIHRGPKHLLRGQLVLLGGMAGGAPPEGAALETFAAGVELLHLFMLIHDDVMDNSTMRRGQQTLRFALKNAEPTVDWQTARDLAIVVGNAIAMLAMQRIVPAPGSSAGAPAACNLMIDACFHAGAGQFQDLLGYRSLRDGETGLRRVLVDKVAYHSFAAPFAAGLLLASPRSDTRLAMRWGEHIGVAFQATDDLADLLTPSSITGKDGLRDLLLGRPSLPLLLLRERASEDDIAFVDSIAGKHVVDVGERAALNDILDRSQIASACTERIRAEVAAATAAAELASFPSAARAGMRVFEDALIAYATVTIAAPDETVR